MSRSIGMGASLTKKAKTETNKSNRKKQEKEKEEKQNQRAFKLIFKFFDSFEIFSFPEQNCQPFKRLKLASSITLKVSAFTLLSCVHLMEIDKKITYRTLKC